MEVDYLGVGNRRNELCSCKSGRKYKKCCLNKTDIISETVNSWDNKKTSFKIHNATQAPDWLEPSHPKFKEALFLLSICSKREILKILNCKDSKDYLLKLRADSINDNMRIFRTILKHKRMHKESWSLEKYFESNDFDEYVGLLNIDNRKRCSELAAGYLFTTEPNGMMMSTEYGKVIVISHSLKYFLYFMNLSNIDYDIDVPIEVRFNALRIAIRLMLQTESLDIEIDPRGEIPKELDETINNSVNSQLKFIIGHEYAHFLFNHLDDRNVHISPLIENGNNDDVKEYKFYNKSQEQEFEADLGSIDLIQCSEFEKEHHLFSAIQFFMYLDIYQHAKNIIFPSGNQYNTHPQAEDRINNLVKNYKGKLFYIDSKLLNQIFETINVCKKFLDEDIGYNFDAYENYGSIYLGPWHKKMLRDRIDY